MSKWYKVMSVGEQRGLNEPISPQLIDDLVRSFSGPVPVEQQAYSEKPMPVLGRGTAAERRSDELWVKVDQDSGTEPPDGFSVAYMSKPSRRILWLFPAPTPIRATVVR